MTDKNTLVFAEEDARLVVKKDLSLGRPWKILVADDETEIHDITRIALGGYSFEGRGVKLLPAYSGRDVKRILRQEDDIALILLDVVMEEDDTGLQLIHYIREELGNDIVRIVLRTGQAGKAPEQEVITKYDINDYKAKTELTAQKLFTAVTASLRAYSSLKTIERNRQGLEQVILSTANLFEAKTLSQFSRRVLNQFRFIPQKGKNRTNRYSGFYGVAPPIGEMKVVAGTGECEACIGSPVHNALSEEATAHYRSLEEAGGEVFFGDEYIGIFKTKEGSSSIIYFNGFKDLSPGDRNLIRIFTTNVFIGFDNLSLTREIIDTQKEVIYTLGEIVETRSRETANHVTRVAETCHILAVEYGMDPKTAQRLKLASPMHDIGKIGIPESILHKPGKLTPEEFEIIKTHADTGYYILRGSKRQIMQTAAIVAWQHHEKWDGSGYPQGLAGEDIHIYGRIAAVADVFDALSHKRCYKDAWPLERIITLFKEESGRHFDPRLVEIFLSRIDRFVEVNRRFPE